MHKLRGAEPLCLSETPDQAFFKCVPYNLNSQQNIARSASDIYAEGQKDRALGFGSGGYDHTVAV
jgi:hypothetical protein